MSEKEQKDLLEEHEDLTNEVKSLKTNICALTAFITSFVASTTVYLYYCNNEQNEREEELYSKNEELRKIICDIHKDTNTPAPKYDFKANKFVTGGYKYDPNLVKKLQELCNKTH